MDKISISPIGIVRSPFPDKFGVPRRSGLIKELGAVIELFPEYSLPGMEKGLSGFSHLWVIFQFHKYAEKKTWSPTVRPPRLGGNKKMGVFASRSPQRPNFIGMSAVKIEQIIRKKNQVLIYISGIDMIDKTPVLDIKPYIFDSDRLNSTSRGWIEKLPIKKSFLKVTISSSVREFIKVNVADSRKFIKLIRSIVAQDPRPSYLRSNPKNVQKNEFTFSFDGYDIGFFMSKVDTATINRIRNL
jgi:tRNA (adenine37-N6)-methyltransferase